MPEFPGFKLTKDGLNLKSKCEAGVALQYTKAQIGSGSLPPGGNAFSATSLAGVITIYNTEIGVAIDAEDGNTGFQISVATQGAPDTAEITTITPVAASELSAGDFFFVHTPTLDFHIYYRIDGIGVDPRPAIGSIGVVADVESLDSAIVVAEKTATAIDQDRVETSDLVRLINFEIDATIAAVQNLGNGTSKLPLQFSNENLAQGFDWREIGIFATDPDLGEILYSATNAGVLSDPVPAQGGATAVEYNLNAITKIGSIVSAIVVPSATYASKEDLSVHIAEGHGVKRYISGAYTAVSHDEIYANTTNNIVEVTLPKNPNAGDWVDFIDWYKIWDQNKLIVKRATSGEPIQEDDSEDMSVGLKGFNFSLVLTMMDDEKVWVIR